jgi:NADP-dependent 3-hydroxy acid dehydrogenase YdfG
MTVFITGATAGFGLAIAKKFAACGAAVVGTGRRHERLVSLKQDYSLDDAKESGRQDT